MGTAISKADVREELGSLKAALQQGNLSDVASQMKQYLDLLKNTSLNIAITGHTGSGKSSLVNALRGMGDFEEGSAETSGLTQATMDVKGYPHPNFPKVTLWDLPGIGTPDFKPEKYLEKVIFCMYDFFIIVAGERFTQHEVQLAREIKKMGKGFYYVRTKVDQSIANERRNPRFNEQEALSKIREYCCESLQKAGEASPKVFLISNHHFNMYDFSLLQETLAQGLDDLKTQVLIMAWPCFSAEAIQKKKAAMESLIWKVALVSCAVGAVPIPGVSLTCDIAILLSMMITMYHVFGLNEASLRRLADCTGKSVDDLKSAIKNTPTSGEITVQYVRDLLSKSIVWTTVTVIELVLDFIPVIGSLFGGASSFATTYLMLRSFLRNVVQDAENVQVKVLDH